MSRTTIATLLNLTRILGSPGCRQGLAPRGQTMVTGIVATAPLRASESQSAPRTPAGLPLDPGAGVVHHPRITRATPSRTWPR